MRRPASRLAAGGRKPRPNRAFTTSTAPPPQTMAGGSGGYAFINDLFGVNMSGMEFPPWNGRAVATAADFTNLAAKGTGYVRLPVAWEDIQPTLSAALSSSPLADVINTVALAWSKGIRTVVELHNFGAYADQTRWTHVSGNVGYAGNAGVAATGVNFLGDGTLTSAHLVDLWTRLTTALTGKPGLIGLGIMNEPTPGVVGVNLLTSPNYFSGSNWGVTNASVPTRLAEGTNPLGASYGPAWTITSGSGFGSVAFSRTFTNVAQTMSVYAKCAAGTEALQFRIGDQASGNKTVTTSWQRFDFTGTPTAGASTAQLQVNAATGHTIQIANAQLELGSSATTYEPNRWAPYAQAAINAIRAVDATVPIYVNGFNYSNAARWLQDNYELSLLTGTGLIYEAHQYFDGAQGVGGGGTYSGSYASYGVNANTGVEGIAAFKAWALAKSVTPFLGEWGQPGNDANWLAVQTAMLSFMRARGIRGTQWFAGANGVQPSNVLNITAALNDARLLRMLAA